MQRCSIYLFGRHLCPWRRMRGRSYTANVTGGEQASSTQTRSRGPEWGLGVENPMASGQKAHARLLTDNPKSRTSTHHSLIQMISQSLPGKQKSHSDIERYNQTKNDMSSLHREIVNWEETYSIYDVSLTAQSDSAI